jgi:hypothetical protein
MECLTHQGHCHQDLGLMPERTPPIGHEREERSCRYPSCEGETRAPVPWRARPRCRGAIRSRSPRRTSQPRETSVTIRNVTVEARRDEDGQSCPAQLRLLRWSAPCDLCSGRSGRVDSPMGWKPWCRTPRCIRFPRSVTSYRTRAPPCSTSCATDTRQGPKADAEVLNVDRHTACPAASFWAE